MKKRCKTCGQINGAMDVICGMCGNDLSNPDNYEAIETFHSTQPSEHLNYDSNNQRENTFSSDSNTNVQNNTYAETALPSGVRRRRNQFGIGKVKSGKRMWSLGISRLIAFCLVAALPAGSYTAYYLTTGLTWKNLALNMAEGTPVEDIINQAIVVQNEENSSGSEDIANTEGKTKNHKKTKKKHKKKNAYVLKNSDKKYIPKSTLKKLSTKKLAIARNEIYARKGRKFATKQWKQYFAKKKWYKPKYSAEYFDQHSNKLLNQYEKKNIRRIKAIEKKRNKKKS